MKILNREIGRGHRPFIIAELSGNHNRSLERAKALISAAAKAGADAIKLQTYTADTMTLNINEGDFLIDDNKSLWNGKSLYQLYEEAHTPWEWHKPLLDWARELGLIAFSSPFDGSAVDFLEGLDVPCYKLASFEITDLNLVKKIAQTGKPMIISTGMSDIVEIGEAIQTAKTHGCKEIILLKCTSTYPASPADSNLSAIPLIEKTFGCAVGLSDHTLGIGVAVAAIAMGACVIEKHFTLDRSEGGVDAAFSLEPGELAQLVVEAQRASEAIGEAKIGAVKNEGSSKKFRRSLYITEDLKKGSVLTEKNLRSIRPGMGLHPKFLEMALGSAVNKDVAAGTRFSFHLIKET